MPGCPIEDLSQGMNLRDPAAAVAPGETLESIGCDFSVPGEVKPMREGLLDQDLGFVILDAHDIYLNEVKYRFTTHADGLRVSYRDTYNNLIVTVIDAAFTGVFKVLPINDQYVVLACATLNRKWMPGWATTYQWGLNTPPLPTITAGAPTTKAIDTFEVLSGWSFTGGGSSAALAADTVHVKAGSQSMKLTCDALTTIIAKRTIALDLSQFVVAGDSGATPFMAFSFYATDLATVNSIKIKLSCAADGGFDSDYFQMVVSLGGYVYAQLAPVYSGSIQSVENPSNIVSTGTDPITGLPTRTEYDPLTQITTQYVQVVDHYETAPGPFSVQMPVYRWDLVQGPTEVKTVTIQTQKRGTTANSDSWTDLKMPFSDFSRIGSAAGRGWGTITAISIELEASAEQSIVSFDGWEMQGGGNLWGYYQVAVAYQNEFGNYGPFTDFTDSIYLESQPLEIDGLTADADPQTIKRRIAIIGGSIVQPMITYLEDNTSTSLIYNELDSALTIIEGYFNNKKPPVGIKDMIPIQGRIFVVLGDNNLNFSLPLFYEAFPLSQNLNLAEGEQFMQVASAGGYVAARGKGREYLVQLSGNDPAFWAQLPSSKQGAVSSRFLIEDPAGVQVWASKVGFGAAGGYYLPKIDPAVADFSQVLGAIAGKKAYLAFTDKDGISRVMRLDYSLNRPVAHYVMELAPAAIWADQIMGKVYYAYGTQVFEFDAGAGPLPTSLKIPEQLCKTGGLKVFVGLSYELEGDDLTLALTLERAAVPGTITLVSKLRGDDISDFPDGLIGGQLGLTLTSAGDYILYMPLEIEVAAL